MVIPIDEEAPSGNDKESVVNGYSGDEQPLMLLALNANDSVDWEDLQEKVRLPTVARC